MAKSVKNSGAGAGNGGGMNEDDFNDMYGTKFLGPDDVKPTRTVIPATSRASSSTARWLAATKWRFR